MPTRTRTVPPGPASGNRSFATAAPLCTLATAPSTSSGAGADGRRTAPSSPVRPACVPRVNVAAVHVLVVAALTEEVAHVPSGHDVLVTGVGKARAATALAGRLAAGSVPDLVVNIGTAGALDPGITGVLEVGFVTQHDFPYDAIEALVGRPVERGYALRADAPPQALLRAPSGVPTVATGDVFVADAEAARRIA